MKIRGKLFSSVAIAGLMLWPAIAAAQNAGARPAAAEAGSDDDVIIVTAQKREESLVKVPISIEVMSGESLDRSTDKGVTDALNRVAGVVAGEGFQTGTTNIRIRGIAAPSPVFSGSSPVGYYLDAAPFGFAKSAAVPNPSVYDLERVEVLRGPQGTLYGANSLNGLVRVLTHDPELDAFDFKGRGRASTTKGGGESYVGDLAVNLPVVTDKLGVRAVVGYQDLGGWIDKPIERDANRGHSSTLRLKVRAKPSDNLDIVLSAWRDKSHYNAPSAADDNGVIGNVPEPADTKLQVYTGKIDYDVGIATLTSMTSYIKYTNRYTVGFGAVPVATGSLNNNLFAKAFSQEVVLNSNGDGGFRWTVGALYRDVRDRLTTFLGPTFFIDKTDTSKSTAVFGQATAVLADGTLELTAGGRYFHDRVATIESRIPSSPPVLIREKTSFNAFTPKAVVTWLPREQLTVYASYSQGFRSGSVPDPTLLRTDASFPPTKPDKLHNYEIGVKGKLNPVVSFDASIYYIDWRDAQQRIGVPFSGGCCLVANINAGKAQGLGADLSLTLRPSRRFEIGATLSVNDLKWQNPVATTVLSGGVPLPVVLFNKGDRPALSPKYSASGWLNYDFPVGDSGFEGRVSASANYTSTQTSPALVGTTALPLAGNKLFFARAEFAIVAPKNWEIGLFVDNLTNENGTPFRLSPERYDTRYRPRTFGIRVDYRL